MPGVERGERKWGFLIVFGANYSGNRRYVVEERDRLIAKEIAALTGGGVFLDLACGDGCLTNVLVL